MTSEQRELWQKTVMLLIHHIDADRTELQLLGVPYGLAFKFVNARKKITADMEGDFRKWLTYLLFEPCWEVKDDTISILLGSVKYHEFSFNGIVRCFISSMNRFGSMGVSLPDPSLIAMWSGYPGYYTAQDVVDGLYYDIELEESMSEFESETGKSGMEAVCATLLAGSPKCLGKCKELLNIQ